MNSLQLTPLILRLCPGFYNLSKDDQQTTRLELHAKHKDDVYRFIEGIISQEIARSGKEDNIFVRGAMMGYYLNRMSGIGENYLVINEEEDMGLILSEMDSITQYNLREWAFHRDLDESPDCRDSDAIPISLLCIGYIEDDIYKTGVINSLSGHVCDKARANAIKIINQYIPNKMIVKQLKPMLDLSKENEINPRKKITFYAYGKEHELRKAKIFLMEYFESLQQTLTNKYHDMEPMYFSLPDGNHTDFVFSNTEALSEFQFSTFIEIARKKKKTDEDVLNEIVQRETDTFEAMLRKELGQ